MDNVWVAAVGAIVSLFVGYLEYKSRQRQTALEEKQEAQERRQAEQQDAISSFKVQIETAQATLTMQQSINDDLRTENGQLKAALQVLQDERISLFSQVDTMGRNIDGLESQADALKQQLERQKSDSDLALAARDATIASLQQQIIALQDDRAARDRQIAKLESKLEERDAEIEDYRSVNDDLAHRIKHLETKLGYTDKLQ